MVVEDISGKKVNADKFEIHLMRECEVTDSNNESPVLVLKGYEHFRNNQFQMTKDEVVLKIMPVCEENTFSIIRIKEDFVNKQSEINRRAEAAVTDIIESGKKSGLLEELLKEISVSHKNMDAIVYLLNKEWLEKQGYKLTREYEFNQSDVSCANYMEHIPVKCKNVEELEPC